jgi:plasmid maintenance system killer protein
VFLHFYREHDRKACLDEMSMKKAFGERRAKALKKRLDDLDAAIALSDMRYLPGRCHELVGDRKGHLALDLDQPYRLIFEPADDPVPTREDGGLEWTQVRVIRILEIGVDYHG